ncbi:hypothetical protein A0H81_14023 [Grifola frondosa]|uniref:Uncharacterized protein n=1 Tax=Grifola frondosa TaxID=5627 RepID=A0A1C7LMP1_GRIFR|nr:hypothetical protein A0H81_14023 [Grifola frondosa]
MGTRPPITHPHRVRFPSHVVERLDTNQANCDSSCWPHRSKVRPPEPRKRRHNPTDAMQQKTALCKFVVFSLEWPCTARMVHSSTPTHRAPRTVSNPQVIFKTQSKAVTIHRKNTRPLPCRANLVIQQAKQQSATSFRIQLLPTLLELPNDPLPTILADHPGDARDEWARRGGRETEVASPRAQETRTNARAYNDRREKREPTSTPTWCTETDTGSREDG